MVAQAFDLSTREVEAGIQSQPALKRGTLSQIRNINKDRPEERTCIRSLKS